MRTSTCSRQHAHTYIHTHYHQHNHRLYSPRWALASSRKYRQRLLPWAAVNQFLQLSFLASFSIPSCHLDFDQPRPIWLPGFAYFTFSVNGFRTFARHSLPTSAYCILLRTHTHTHTHTEKCVILLGTKCFANAPGIMLYVHCLAILKIVHLATVYNCSKAREFFTTGNYAGKQISDLSAQTSSKRWKNLKQSFAYCQNRARWSDPRKECDHIQ